MKKVLAKVHPIWMVCLITVVLVVIIPNKRVDPGNSRSVVKTEPNPQPKWKKASKREVSEAFLKWHREIRTPDDGNSPEYGENQIYDEYMKSRVLAARARTENLDILERGPRNAAGRTRAIHILGSDPNKNTWLVGSVSGGIWKSTDRGENWTEKSTELPHIGISWFAAGESDPDIIYAGTGEPFPVGGIIDGIGIYKSIDAGESWIQVTDLTMYPDLKNVSRLIVDPDNSDIVVATSRTSIYRGNSFFDADFSIYKTTDGGATWSRKFTSTEFNFEDLEYQPGNFNIQFASANGEGVFRSTDAGETWAPFGTGLFPSGRMEMAISPVNPDVMWISAVGSQSGNNADLYRSQDAGENWTLLVAENPDDNVDFLIQGGYDNIIMAHPFDENVAYVGGVLLWKFTYKGGSAPSIRRALVDENGTDAFMSFVNFGGEFYGGRLDVGEPDSLVEVEIRFGQGSQFAHRFIVDKRGAGVPDEEYKYQDYVEVPFQAWDVTNNIQLMVSFRDQQEDGAWNLILEETQDDNTEIHSREYFFVHQIPYAETANGQISINGGQTVKQLYFMWPFLVEGATFNPENLPQSSVDITLEFVEARTRGSFQMSADAARGGEEGDVNLSRQLDDPSEDGVHVDHHNLIPITYEGEVEFEFLNSNDGGIYISDKSTEPGTELFSIFFKGFGLNTTQFYTADKAPGENRFIGGSQDNGTWISNTADPGPNSDYTLYFGGDGLETVWNNKNPNLIIGSVPENRFFRSEDGGATVQFTTFNDPDSPFRTRISNSRAKPDILFSVGSLGVWRSIDFGLNWEVTRIDSSTWRDSHVEVSDANNDIIWAGGGISETSRMFVSTDGGKTYDETNNYSGTQLGRISGLGVHPTEQNTAFALFSFSGRPKVLKTTDLGQTWSDISGFEGSSNGSDRGFPDVAVFTILVFPNDTDRIWVGTEIGIYETTNGGDNWAPINSSLPNVSVYDLRIQDDQIIIATYGRGIWSYQVPEIQRDYFFAPTLVDFSIDPLGNTSFVLDYSNEFDSTIIFIDGEPEVRIGTNEQGTLTKTIDNLGIEGSFIIDVVGYSNGDAFDFTEIERLFFDPEEPAESYSNDFNSNTEEGIFNQGFVVTRIGGFNSSSLQTDHPYQELTDYISLIKTPIEITNEEATLTYRDIAIVETGEPSTVFGDFEFWDYVIVEGTTDGKTWLPLAPGYDASFDPVWEETYDLGSDGTNDMFVDHEISLTDTFNIGDVILVRFRLFSDPAAVGWGWMVDDIQIQNVVLGLDKEFEGKFEIYPNPVTDISTVAYDSPENGFLTLIGMDGKILWSEKVAKGKGNLQFQRGNLKTGVYVLKLETLLGTRTRRLLIQQ